MRVGFDIRSLVEEKITGVGEYAKGLLIQLIKDNPGDDFLLFYNSFKPIKADLSYLEKYQNVEIRRYKFPNKLFNFLVWFLGWPKLDVLLGGVDVFWSPNISFLALSKNCPLVLTIHDLSFERFPEFFSLKKRLWHFIINPKKLCQRADKLLAVSLSTQDDLIGIYNINPKKIKIITPIKTLDYFLKNKPTENQIKKVIKGYSLPKDYLLYLGTIEPRKNLVNLILAYELVKKEKIGQNLKLVLAGQLGWKYNQVLNCVEKSKYKQEIIFPGYVKSSDKVSIYAGAKAFIFPSFFEGFGFPVAEAMASGAPVIAANNSSLPEVAGEAAILVDAYSVEDIFQAIKLILESPSLQKKHVLRGKKQAEKIAFMAKKRLKLKDFL
ncbi:MAG TPA: glycosyltransferase family 4 protein [Candidatus Moranbacteria bacterium]|nr:glycosyltransferase family 4 protein [Candidatus Moranbacteria bacterium]